MREQSVPRNIMGSSLVLWSLLLLFFAPGVWGAAYGTAGYAANIVRYTEQRAYEHHHNRREPEHVWRYHYRHIRQLSKPNTNYGHSRERSRNVASRHTSRQLPPHVNRYQCQRLNVRRVLVDAGCGRAAGATGSARSPRCSWPRRFHRAYRARRSQRCYRARGRHGGDRANWPHRPDWSAGGYRRDWSAGAARANRRDGPGWASRCHRPARPDGRGRGDGSHRPDRSDWSDGCVVLDRGLRSGDLDDNYHLRRIHPVVIACIATKASQVISFTSTVPSSATVGGPTYNVMATATSGLPVTFTIDQGATSICSISGSTVSFIGVGTCSINADQAGDSNYNEAPTVQQSFGVTSSIPSCQHSNGLGQTYTDCQALGTPGNQASYNVTMATEARAAWPFSGTDSAGTCGAGGGAAAMSRQTASSCAVWAYTGSIAGYVHLNSATNQCFCPTTTDPTWN